MALTGPGALYAPPYLFPTLDIAADQRQIDSDKNLQGFQQIVEGQGSALSTGVNTLWVDGGRIVATFIFHHAFLRTRGFTEDITGLANALAEYDAYVTQGGLGLLTWLAPPGFKNPITGASIWRAVCSAIFRGTNTLSSPTATNDYATLQANIEVPSGYWSCSDGSFLSSSGII